MAHNVIKGLRGGCLLLLGAVLISSCAAPQFRYVADSGDKAYFKVPYGWRQVAPSDMCAFMMRALNVTTCPPGYHVAYEAIGKPAAIHYVADNLNQPFVVVDVFANNAQTGGPVTTDALENAYLPVTASARTSAAIMQNFRPVSFALLQVKLVSIGGEFHGVRETYSYTFGDNEPNTYGVAAFTNSAGTLLYRLVVHCRTTCYKQDKAMFDAVVSSFTMRRY